MRASLTVTLLGPVLAKWEGKPIELGSPRQRTLFAVLAAHANRRVGRDELVDAIWGSSAPATAVNSVYTYIARLRNSLEPDRSSGGRPQVLISDRLGYRLRIEPEGTDVQRFTTALATARQLRAKNAVESAVAELRAGLALWHGMPYGGAVGPFVQAERTRLAELRVLALEDCMEMLLALGQPVDMVGELAGLVRLHPLRERLRYLLMRCYAELGWHADAIREYHSLRSRLAEEQGIEPSDHVRRLYEQVLRGDRSRARPSREPSAPSPPGAGPVALPSQLIRAVPHFTGRTEELALLDRLAVEETGRPALLLLTGGAGVGKTALATRFAHAAAPRFPDGQLHVDLAAHPQVPGHKAPDAALRHLVAVLGQTAPSAGVDVWAAYRGLVAGRRLLIVLDNAACAEQVRALLPGTSSSLVLVTSRNGLPGLIAREGARRIVLDGLPEDDAVRLFGRLMGEPFVARHRPAVRRLVAACDGLPLAIRIAATRLKVAPSAEAALAGFDDGDLVDFLELPGDRESSLSAVIGSSYEALPPEAALVFTALGRQHERMVTLRLAATLSGTEPSDCRRALHTLVDAGLLREAAPDRFRLGGLVLAYARRLAGQQSSVAGQRAEADGRSATITTIVPSTDNERLQMIS
ncbi:AfsR/SARP family transcriptional regulator [Streptomyces sclerotialus]|uniref:AfsR/SARP family transcriptional regulator n=1 Tax=Streptomyces sclerotialus TaxID=1957 RepID=UPI0034A281BC